MKAKALSVFRTKLRLDKEVELVVIGQVIEGDDDHMRDLARNHLVELLDDDDAGTKTMPISKGGKGKKK